MLSDKFKDQATNIAEKLSTLIERGEWTHALTEALTAKNFAANDEQMNAIKNAATPTMLSDQSPLSHSLTHAFRDPIQKSATFMSFIQEEVYEEDETLNILMQTHDFLDDIVTNYTQMLGGDMPEGVKNIIDEYRDTIIPELSFMIDYAANQADIDIDTFKFDTGEDDEGVEHLERLPENIFDPQLNIA